MNVSLSSSCRIALRVGNQGARPPDLAQYAVEKSATVLPSHSQLLKGKQITYISSYNARTLTNGSQSGELTAAANQHNHDIICIQEHRIFHDDCILKHHDMGKRWLLATSSAIKNSINASIGGVGLLLSPKAKKSFNNIESITPRILIATFKGNPKTSVICCYSPTSVSDKAKVENFYNDLSSLTQQIPKHNVTIIGGDFNAKLGRNNGFIHSFHEESNRNGKLLNNFLMESNMVCLNTLYRKRSGKKWTFTYPNGINAQIDFLLINKKWLDSSLNCEPFTSFSEGNSDHRIITAKIRLSLRANKQKTLKVPRYDWSALNDRNTAEQFKITLTNRYTALQNEYGDVTPNTSYQNFEKACSYAAEEMIPVRRKPNHRIPWESDSIIVKRTNLKKASIEKNQNPSRENRYQFRRAQNELK